jgi:hypothetical protein
VYCRHKNCKQCGYKLPPSAEETKKEEKKEKLKKVLEDQPFYTGVGIKPPKVTSKVGANYRSHMFEMLHSKQVSNTGHRQPLPALSM